MITRDQVPDLLDTVVYDNDGEKVGKVGQVYFDQESNQPSWVTVNTGLFGMKESFVPLQQARAETDGLQVAVNKQEVKDAPRVESDSELPPEREAELYSHYGLGPDGYAASNQSDGYDPSQSFASDGRGQSDQAMTRSEERLNVRTEQTEQGRARLRKHVVTEHVQQTVPLRHEEVRLEREPVTEANRRSALDGPEISEADHEVTLHAERPVVETETVPVERVRLSTDTVTEQQRVDGDIRKEKIEFEGSGQQRPPR